MSYQKQHEFGLIGLALLRTWLIGNKYTTRKVLIEMIELANSIKNTSSLTLKKVNLFGVGEGYKNWVSTYDSLPNILIEVEEPVVRGILKKLPRGIALDAGCGTGRYSKFLYSLGYSVTGVDLSEEMLQKARTNSKQISFIRGDLNELSIKNGSNDLVISALALTHLPDINQALTELSRVVRIGGHVVISDIHPWLVALGGQADFYDSAGKYGYVRNYVHWHSAYIQAFQKNNLKIIRCVEPTINSEHLELAQKGFELSVTTVSTALQGLPAALIWVLEKE